ncbi:MAG: DNA polymerase III subunit gamma/tau [Acidobacteriota bacterium]|nr:DNA polymerase III subunit gamma/tau [Acidobacteriota bacterium]MDH3522261.1 DNA polymerase III subunit gamma/tau [Acidobacteriota bacterium]
MTYQVLARKSRPTDFDAVVGQEPIVTALRNALREKRIAQAYLFSGIRGVGKTSVARILARALNCERGFENGPCNECETCREMESGASLDLFEIDAATYSKVEQVRELTENLKYKPVRGPYKIVVLDEVHRLSRQAFDALLKIVEEPPPHLVFIFATTELESVPATILSRCQEFNFRRVPRPILMELLRKLAAEEQIEVADKALRLIARASEGSVRDAVALLDQLATYGSGKIGDDEASRVLGGVDAALHHRLLAAVIAGDRAGIVAVVAEIDEQGWDPRHVYAEFLSYCRDALHLALGGAIDEVDLPDEDARAAAQLGRDAGYENVLRLLHQLLSSEESVRRSEAGLLAVEIAWLRGAELPRLTRIETLLAGSPPAAGSAAPDPRASAPPRRPERPHGAPRAAPAAPAAEAAAGEPPRPEPRPMPPPVPRPESPPPAAAGADGDGERTAVAGFLELIGQRRQVIAAHLADVESLTFEAGLLTMVTRPGDDFLEQALRRDANREAFEACLERAFGAGAGWRIDTAAGRSAPGGHEAAAADPGSGRAEAPGPEADSPLAHPTVQAALDIFGGTAETIDEARPHDPSGARPQ